MRAARVASLAVMAVSLSGCAAIQTRLWTKPADYHAYRETRITEGLLPRLRAQRAYLVRFPSGAFQEEVTAAFERDEGTYYAAHNRTKPGLEEYLAGLPDGPHTMDASLRLADLKERSGEASTERLLARSRSTEQRLRLAAEHRRAALESVSEWLGDLVTVKEMGKIVDGTPRLSKTFDAHFQRPPKPPACEAARCLRLESWPYQVPVVGGGLDELEVTVQVTVRRAGAAVTSVSIHGPAMFSRAWEASRGLPIAARRSFVR